MKEHISMSPKELSRYEDLKKVLDKRQTVARAAESLGLGPRQAKRLIKRLKAEGPKGLISKKNRRLYHICLLSSR